MATFFYHVTLIDTKALKTNLRFMLAATDYVTARADATDIEYALGLVTDANIYQSSVIEQVTGAADLPADADITDEALVVTYLSGTGEIPKFWNLRVPAPVAAMFNADGVTVDITYQNLQDLVATLSTKALVSDGEAIDLDIQEGIASGFWRSVKKSSR
jgi:hypothetical protein